MRGTLPKSFSIELISEFDKKKKTLLLYCAEIRWKNKQGVGRVLFKSRWFTEQEFAVDDAWHHINTWKEPLLPLLEGVE